MSELEVKPRSIMPLSTYIEESLDNSISAACEKFGRSHQQMYKWVNEGRHYIDHEGTIFRALHMKDLNKND